MPLDPKMRSKSLEYLASNSWLNNLEVVQVKDTELPDSQSLRQIDYVVVSPA
jgi:hypothetical protein